MVRPRAVGPAGHDVRGHQRPAIGDRGVARHELYGGHGEPLAEGVLCRGQVARGARAVWIPDGAAHLAGDVDPRRLAKAEAAKRLVEPLAAEFEADLGRPVVVRQLQDLLRGDRSMAPGMVEAVRVLDPDPRDREVVAVDDLGRGGDRTGVQRRRDGEGLHDRAGLVGTRHGRVAV